MDSEQGKNHTSQFKFPRLVTIRIYPFFFNFLARLKIISWISSSEAIAYSLPWLYWGLRGWRAVIQAWRRRRWCWLWRLLLCIESEDETSCIQFASFPLPDASLQLLFLPTYHTKSWQTYVCNNLLHGVTHAYWDGGLDGFLRDDVVEASGLAEIVDFGVLKINNVQNQGHLKNQRGKEQRIYHSLWTALQSEGRSSSLLRCSSLEWLRSNTHFLVEEEIQIRFSNPHIHTWRSDGYDCSRSVEDCVCHRAVILAFTVLEPV